MSSNPNILHPHMCVMQVGYGNSHRNVLLAGNRLKPMHSNTHSYILIPLGATQFSNYYAELNIAAVNELVKDLQQLVSEFVEKELDNANQTD